MDTTIPDGAQPVTPSPTQKSSTLQMIPAAQMHKLLMKTQRSLKEVIKVVQMEDHYNTPKL